MFEVCWDNVDSGSELGWMSEYWFYKLWEWWLYMGGQWIEDCELCRIEEFEYWKWLICWIEWIWIVWVGWSDMCCNEWVLCLNMVVKQYWEVWMMKEMDCRVGMIVEYWCMRRWFRWGRAYCFWKYVIIGIEDMRCL